jgi:hypothetical protein
MNKEIKLREELIKIKEKAKEMQNKPKNIQYGKSATYFTIAIALDFLHNSLKKGSMVKTA